MQEQLKKVQEFHTVFQQPFHETPSIGTLTEGQLRHRLMKEENEEYLSAVENGDLIEIADALGDQLYILCGTILKHGMQYKIEEVFQLIHNSNMTKLDENGKPILREDGKVMKGFNYQKVDLKPLFNEPA